MSSLRRNILLFLAVSVATTVAFSPSHHAVLMSSSSSSSTRLFAEKKGFGPTPSPKPKRKQQAFNEESDRSIENPAAVELNQGQRALEELRRERAEKRDAELRAVREVRSVDDFIGENPDAAVIPEIVAMRMGRRMLPFVGIPLLGGGGAFVAFWYLATYKNMEFQPAMVAFSTIALLATGLVGITFSLMSASWDPDREGSFLGFDEFSRNLDSLRGGLSRSRENALIRERMDGMSEAEIQAAMRDLEKREKQKKDKMQEIKELQNDQWDG